MKRNLFCIIIAFIALNNAFA
ncbi:hypothetical protein EZS27_038334, partial [termite gut metagenome]